MFQVSFDTRKSYRIATRPGHFWFYLTKRSITPAKSCFSFKCILFKFVFILFKWREDLFKVRFRFVSFSHFILPPVRQVFSHKGYLLLQVMGVFRVLQEEMFPFPFPGLHASTSTLATVRNSFESQNAFSLPFQIFNYYLVNIVDRTLDSWFKTVCIKKSSPVPQSLMDTRSGIM